MSDAKAVYELQARVLERELMITQLIRGAGIPKDEITLLALLAIVHLTFASATLKSEEMTPAFELAQEILEAKKKGVM